VHDRKNHIESDEARRVFDVMEKLNHFFYQPLTVKPWGVRRFGLGDPFGRLISILSHSCFTAHVFA
jgi:hypothetical protein